MAARKKAAAPVKAKGKAATSAKVPVAHTTVKEVSIAQATCAAQSTALAENATFKRTNELTYQEKLRVINGLRQKNPEMFVSAEDLSTAYTLRRPTGIIELDIALGGGFPAGGASMLSGPYNCGKSWMLWRMFAMQQRIYGPEFIGAIAHTEGAMDYEYIRRCGCYVAVPDDVINSWNELRYQRGLPQLTSTEIDFWKLQVGHIETIQGDTGEQILTGVLNLTEKGICNIVAVDSISSLQSQKDADKDLDEEAKRGAHAQLMKQFWLRYVPQTRRGSNYTTTMMVQQVVQRDKSNAGYAAKYLTDWEVRGGESSKHYKLIDLVLYPGSKIKDKDNVSIGKEIKFQTLKGKAGTHDNITGSFNYYYGAYGTDVCGDIIASAVCRGIIVHCGSHISVLNAQTRQPLDDVTYKTDREIYERMSSDVSFEFAIRREILASAGVQCLYR